MQISPITQWSTPAAITPYYEKMLGAIGTRSFGAKVREALAALIGGPRRLYLFEAAEREDSDLQYSFCEPGVRELFPVYSKFYLPLDPISDAYRAAPADGDAVLQRVRPDDIASASFRRRFFDDPGIAERISVVQRGRDTWRALSIARHRSSGCFSDRELDGIVGLASLALPMLPLNRKCPVKADPLSVVQLEERFAEARWALTHRELQVCARAAVGMNVEATALDLGIAKSSVLTYRKRAYSRLGISSPFELSALVCH